MKPPKDPLKHRGLFLWYASASCCSRRLNSSKFFRCLSAPTRKVGDRSMPSAMAIFGIPHRDHQQWAIGKGVRHPKNPTSWETADHQIWNINYIYISNYWINFATHKSSKQHTLKSWCRPRWQYFCSLWRCEVQKFWATLWMEHQLLSRLSRRMLLPRGSRSG